MQLRTELALYSHAEEYLLVHTVDRKVTPGVWKADVARLTSEKDRLYAEMRGIWDEAKEADAVMRNVRLVVQPEQPRRRQVKRRDMELQCCRRSSIIAAWEDIDRMKFIREVFMGKKIFCQAAVKFITGLLLVGTLLFFPAGTFSYWQAWLLIAVLFIPMLCAGTVLMLKNPQLLQKRLNAREGEAEQKQVIALSGIMFLAAFTAAGLNVRFGWFILPAWASYAAAVVFLAAYAVYAEVLRENVYLSRTVEVQEDQKVIDTGLYGIVRHPMYMATLFLFLSMPIILGSAVSFMVLLFYIPLIAKRIRNEEKVLEQGLNGYQEYKKKVKYRVIPYIW